MVEIPVVDDVLVVPHDFPCVRVERESAIVIQVLVVIAAKDEFWRGYGYRCPDIDEVQFRIVTWNHPCADVPALLHRDTAPRLIARLAGAGYRSRAPDFLTRLGVMRRDDVSLVSGTRLT